MVTGPLSKPVIYAVFNILVGCAIVFANKTVLSIYDFKFVYALTLVHTTFTMLGMWLFAEGKLFEVKHFRAVEVAPLAVAFVGYVVFWNWSLEVNSVGFYQLSKVMIMPTVAALEMVMTRRSLTCCEYAAIGLIVLGVAIATVVDKAISTNMLGIEISVGAILFSALYQVWIGTKQRELQAGSMQLMHQYCPWAAGLLAVLVPVFEPIGFAYPSADTILGFAYTPEACLAIASSAVLGLLVSWSTFLMIGATSGLTYNVISQLKLVLVLAGGVFFFGDQMPPQKLAGVTLALAGILWYSLLGLRKKADMAVPAHPEAQLKLAKSLNGSLVHDVSADDASEKKPLVMSSAVHTPVPGPGLMEAK